MASCTGMVSLNSKIQDELLESLRKTNDEHFLERTVSLFSDCCSSNSPLLLKILAIVKERFTSQRMGENFLISCIQTRNQLLSRALEALPTHIETTGVLMVVKAIFGDPFASQSSSLPDSRQAAQFLLETTERVHLIYEPCLDMYALNLFMDSKSDASLETGDHAFLYIAHGADLPRAYQWLRRTQCLNRSHERILSRPLEIEGKWQESLEKRSIAEKEFDFADNCALKYKGHLIDKYVPGQITDTTDRIADIIFNFEAEKYAHPEDRRLGVARALYFQHYHEVCSWWPYVFYTTEAFSPSSVAISEQFAKFTVPNKEQMLSKLRSSTSRSHEEYLILEILFLTQSLARVTTHPEFEDYAKKRSDLIAQIDKLVADLNALTAQGTAATASANAATSSPNPA